MALGKGKAPARGHRGLGEYTAKAIAWGAQGGSLNVLIRKRGLWAFGSPTDEKARPAAPASRSKFAQRCPRRCPGGKHRAKAKPKLLI